jgi:hypothetical protein
MNKMDYINFKINIKIKLCQTIVKNHQTYTEEVGKILQGYDDYKYNDKQKKKEKHFPAHYITYDKYIEKYNTKNGTISSSLSSKSVPEQVEDMIDTAKRRNVSILN